MEKILVLLHTLDGELPPAALETLGLAQRLGAAHDLGVVGAGAAAAAQRVSGGAERCFAVEGEAFAVSRYATDAAACEAVIRASGAPLVLAPDTLRFHRCLPGVAERFGAAVDTHVTALSAEGLRNAGFTGNGSRPSSGAASGPGLSSWSRGRRLRPTPSREPHQKCWKSGVRRAPRWKGSRRR